MVNPPPARPRRPAPSARMARTLTPLLLATLLALAAACSTSGDDAIRVFRRSHEDCLRKQMREPCQIGPDGRLYRFNPDEQPRLRRGGRP